jgi:hypothetical protein
MTCEQLRDEYELYSLGLLEGDEKAEVDAHLSQGCETCQAYLKDAIAIEALLLSQAPPVVPPARLKRRVVNSVGAPGFSWNWLAALAAASMVVVALWFSLQARSSQQALTQARQELMQITAERDRLEQASSFFEEPETRQVNFGQPQATPPRGNIYLHPRLGVLLIASNLPPLSANQAYEMWVIPKGGAPRPAGVFQSAQDGTAIHVLGEPIDITQVGAVAVTIEPASGSAAPTMPIIIAAQLGA